MPVWTGFANYIIPLMIGARDMAFPRLNALSYWLLVAGAVVLYSSFIFGLPAAGWTSYVMRRNLFAMSHLPCSSAGCRRVCLLAPAPHARLFRSQAALLVSD